MIGIFLLYSVLLNKFLIFDITGSGRRFMPIKFLLLILGDFESLSTGCFSRWLHFAKAMIHGRCVLFDFAWDLNCIMGVLFVSRFAPILLNHPIPVI